MAGTSRIRMETAQKFGNLALDLGNKHRISKPVANVRCETCPKGKHAQTPLLLLCWKAESMSVRW